MFLIEDGGDGAVLKISNVGEDSAVVDLEASALRHIERVDPELPVARQRGAATVEGPDGTHFVRLFERMRGRAGGPELGDDAVFAFAATNARMTGALRGFFHPAAGARPPLEPGAGAAASSISPRYPGRRPTAHRRARPRPLRGAGRPALGVPPGADRARRLHARQRLPRRAGPHRRHRRLRRHELSARAGDFAIGLVSLLRGRPEDDVFRVARIAVDGYASRIPLEDEELDLLADLVAARLAALVTISAWRVERYPENAEYIQSWDADSWTLLELFDEVGLDAVARELGATQPPIATDELVRRRSAALGSALTGLTYRRPVHLVRGEGSGSSTRTAGASSTPTTTCPSSVTATRA